MSQAAGMLHEPHEPLSRSLPGHTEALMIKNMGSADRTIRIIAAVIIGALYFTDRINGPLATVLGVVAIVLLLTSLVGWCPAYLPLKLSTRRRSEGLGGG
jgi:hypothetical protein